MTALIKILLSVIIVCLIVTLVFTICGPKTNITVTKTALAEYPKPIPIPHAKPLDTNFENIWRPRPLNETTPTNIDIALSEINLQLTGTIIEPDFSAAFIMDKSNNNKEDLYYEGDSIRDWLVEKITINSTYLYNRLNNQRIVLNLSHDQASSRTKPLPVVVKPPDPTQESYTPDSVDNMLKTTSLDTALNMAARLPEETIKSILNKLPQDYLRDKLANAELGLSPEELNKLSPADIIISLAKVGQGNIPAGGAPVYFSTSVNKLDNTPLTATISFKRNDKRIYACFKNEGELAKLEQVVVYWMNLDTRKVIYWGAQPIDPETSYNYVWVEEKSGWEAGSYIVAIFKHAGDTNCLAQGKFDIK
jgi:hypothetical protein